MTSRLACSGVSVKFGGIVALSDLTVEIPPQTTIGLVGPNGAGKSTLFGVLSGLVRPTQGSVSFNGVDVTTTSPQRRAALGLARTFQHPELFPGLTVRDHLVLAYRAKHAKRRVWSDLLCAGSLRRAGSQEKHQVDELIGTLGLRPFADRPGSGLPLGIARLLELGRALAASPTVLLLDEPSSGMDATATDQFEHTVRTLSTERGLSVLLVEHDVDLVMRMCAEVYVLDFGKLIAKGAPEAIRADPGVRAAYLGEELTSEAPVASSPSVSVQTTSADPSAGVPMALEVENLGVVYGGATALRNVSFTLPQGQALAVLGPNGAGKSSLARALSGLVPSTGRICVGGTLVTGWSPHRVRGIGLIHLPEGRGVFRGLSVTENLRMAAPRGPDRAASIERALEIFPQLKDRLRQPAALLSGGEQQMLSLARALMATPQILVADELSLGLAPQLVDMVFESLERARKAGVSVVMTEQYVHRAIGFADQCLVLHRGEVSWSGPAEQAKQEVLGRYLGDGLMAGAG